MGSLISNDSTNNRQCIQQGGRGDGQCGSGGGGDNGQCGGGGNGKGGQCGGGGNRVQHTKPFVIKTIMFNKSKFDHESIKSWLALHKYDTKNVKLIDKPTGAYTHAVLNKSTKFTVFRNKKINKNITILFAK